MRGIISDMEREIRKGAAGNRTTATLRGRNQLTIPSAVARRLNLHEGDVVIIDLQDDCATMTPVKRSYAGSLAGVYGDADEYVRHERGSWD